MVALDFPGDNSIDSRSVPGIRGHVKVTKMHD